MKLSTTQLLIASAILIGSAFGVYKFAFSSCCSSTSGATAGCTPSSCRGAKTKFGEAKVISELRLELIALKADMEQSEDPIFDERSYDIHGIIGDSDDESLEIIANEVEIVETAFVEKLAYNNAVNALPDNKAKKIQHLSDRIEELRNLL